MAAGPPSDWTLWLRDAFAVDADLHLGTAGVADEAFFGELFAYMTKYRAPERVSVAVQFIHAISAWDWPAADSIGERVVRVGAQPTGLPIGGDVVRDGLVVAKLQRGDAIGARKAFSIMAGHGTRSRRDLRNRLLNAWIERAEAQMKTAPAPKAVRQQQP